MAVLNYGTVMLTFTLVFPTTRGPLKINPGNLPFRSSPHGESNYENPL